MGSFRRTEHMAGLQGHELRWCFGTATDCGFVVRMTKAGDLNISKPLETPGQQTSCSNVSDYLRLLDHSSGPSDLFLRFDRSQRHMPWLLPNQIFLFKWKAVASVSSKKLRSRFQLPQPARRIASYRFIGFSPKWMSGFAYSIYIYT